MVLLLFLALFQTQNLPAQNSQSIALLAARTTAIERQLDRIEVTLVNVSKDLERHAQNGSSGETTDILLYVLLALLGIDKGSYWVKGYAQRRNGKKNGDE